ncbi:arylamine N-acetyltransferase [Staphylococcus sp. ACRSN]|uniref:arylamine N-acetyltransferase family protein n=1 Tax=Staphylococcus sp. ACRSN TaxID=2918214 RepID=UPI001EF1953C|nr:arylamine N-acetyltransferase [Staphylococcus sp. ACRSN]MCG7337807.1 arylamine N-acetyltransferase [Staphylococcus sp. ACRSN]
MNIKKLEKHLNIDTSIYPKPSVHALNYYMQRFMFTVPFENIDVQNGVAISVSIDDIFNKVVNHHRGGFCYELNSLFKAYLEAKGFTVDMVSATIHIPGGGRSLKGSHVSLIVTVDEQRYVTDVGFGDLPIQALPISIEENEQIIDDINGQYRAITTDNQIIYSQKLIKGSWVTQYEADLIAKSIETFNYNIDYNQYHPDSIFVQKLLITQPQDFGRATMSHEQLTLTKGQQKEKYPVTSSNYKQLLQKYFNLDVTINKLEK